MGLKKLCALFILVIAAQCTVYFYLDRVIFLPTEAFHISENKQALDLDNDGKTYYSYDRKFAAKTADDKVIIYNLQDKNAQPQEIELNGQKVSFFEWLPDRNLAILALYGKNAQTKKYDVHIRQYNPLMPDNKAETALKDVPVDSKIVDVVYSTATNAVYMKLRIGEDRFRIYRTDANYDTRRIYVQAENIGKIAVFSDKDNFLYDNLKNGYIYMFSGNTGSWRTISPLGKFRLIGIDGETIYIAKYNKDNSDKISAVYRGRLGSGFKELQAYEEPRDFSDITLAEIKNI